MQRAWVIRGFQALSCRGRDAHERCSGWVGTRSDCIGVCVISPAIGAAGRRRRQPAAPRPPSRTSHPPALVHAPPAQQHLAQSRPSKSGRQLTAARVRRTHRRGRGGGVGDGARVGLLLGSEWCAVRQRVEVDRGMLIDLVVHGDHRVPGRSHKSVRNAQQSQLVAVAPAPAAVRSCHAGQTGEGLGWAGLRT